MPRATRLLKLLLLLPPLLAALPTHASAQATFRVATFNIENYLDAPTQGRTAKTSESRARIRAAIHGLRADVLALQEMGSTNALLELRQTLHDEGLDYPHWEHVTGFDTNIHIAVLSRFPLAGRRPHTNDSFLLGGRRLRVSRGFAEVDVQLLNYSFTLLAVHLKSRRPVPEADEQELREEEARVLRRKIDARLAANPEANLVVLGDFNDLKDSRTLRTIIGRGRTALIDTRPAEFHERAAGTGTSRQGRLITWTHYYGKEDTYSRIDYILLSRGMDREWVPSETYVFTQPDWGAASDHRPLVATFRAADR